MREPCVQFCRNWLAKARQAGQNEPIDSDVRVCIADSTGALPSKRKLLMRA